MPKMKTNRAAAKRFKVTGSGKFMKTHSFKRHILEKKSAKRKRALGLPETVHKADAKRVSVMLPYSK